MKAFFQRIAAGMFVIPLLASLCLSACGGGGQPFVMTVNSTIVVGDSVGTPLKFIANPEQQDVQGSLTAEVSTELRDRFELDVTALDVTANFTGLGAVHLVLDPNFVSTATVFKLNRNNNPFGTNQMNLSMIVETPDQNLTFSHMTLQSDTAILTLAEDLPTIDFFFQGQPKEIDISVLQVQIPAQLIHSTEDPQ